MEHGGAERPSGASDVATGKTLRLRDGRTLGYGVWGLPSGFPVLGFHGTGASRLFHYGDEVPRAAGVRLILPDRPGFGLSDPHSSGTLLDWVQDVEQLANALQINQFAVFGVSGGGPPALACGFARPDRVTTVGLVSAVGPCQDEPEIIPHLPEQRRQLAELARRDLAAAQAMIRRDCEEGIAALARAPEGDTWTGPDHGIMADPIIGARFIASRRELVRRGPEGNVHDHLVNYAKPWGFRITAIRVPVYVWHGTQDPIVPVEIARYVARHIPGARLIEDPDWGHMGSFAGMGKILGTLAASASSHKS